MVELAEATLRHEADNDRVRLGSDDVVGRDLHGYRRAALGASVGRAQPLLPLQKKTSAKLHAKMVSWLVPSRYCTADLRSISGSFQVFSNSGFLGP